MSWQVELEDLEIIGEYYDNNGRRVRGAFATSDDSAVIVNVNVFEKLLQGAVAYDEELTLEQIEEKYGDEIVKNFAANHGVADIFSFEEIYEVFGSQFMEKLKKDASLRAAEATRENQKRTTPVLIEKGKRNQAFIIKAVLEGMMKLEIERDYGVCRTTVNNSLKGLSEEKMNDIWSKYKDTVFENTDRQLADDFISCGCDYVAYRWHLDSRTYVKEAAVDVAEDGVVDEVDDETSDEQSEPEDDEVSDETSEPEDDEIPDDFLADKPVVDEFPNEQSNEVVEHVVTEEMSDEQPEALVEEISNKTSRGVVEEPAPTEEAVADNLADEKISNEETEQTYDKSAYVAALKQKSEDNPATLEDVIDLFNEPDFELPKFQKPITVNDDNFVEMYSKRTMHPEERPKVDTSMSDGGNCQILKARKGVGLYTESIY